MDDVPFGDGLRTRTGRTLLISFVLVCSLLLAGTGYVLTTSHADERFTSFYVLTETEDGDLVADEYPRELMIGNSERVVIGIKNNEHRPIEYTVVVTLTPTTRSSGSTPGMRSEELDRFSVRMDSGEESLRGYELSPTTTGQDLQLAFLLYRESPPEDPSINNSYRNVYFPVNVSDG
jgi:uncharacterized membrane protein